MPDAYDDTRGPDTSEGWIHVSEFKGADGELVNLWLEMNFGSSMTDAFEVPQCWRAAGHWYHVHRGKPAELRREMVTHWRPVRVTGASPAEPMPAAIAAVPAAPVATPLCPACAARDSRTEAAATLSDELAGLRELVAVQREIIARGIKLGWLS